MGQRKKTPEDLEPEKGSPFIAPRELAARWQCSRSQVDRIAARENIGKLLIGTGRNGMVRYVLSDVLSLENRSLTRAS